MSAEGVCKFCGLPPATAADQYSEAQVALQSGGWMHHDPCWRRAVAEAAARDEAVKYDRAGD